MEAAKRAAVQDDKAKAVATSLIEAKEGQAPPFKRTVCGCRQCIDCCRHPGPLHPDDVARIAKVLPGENVMDYLCASPGALVRNTDTGHEFSVGTITPKTVRGRCVFLTPDEKCSIHAVSPFGCAYFDMHMRPSEGQRRDLWLYRAIQSSAAYKKLRAILPLAANYKPRK